MAYEIAREEEISPWEGLLRSVRLSANRVAWVDQQLTEAQARNDGNESALEVRGWLKESRNERRLLAQVSKAAIDGGVAERMVRQVELEGRAVAAAVAAAIDALGNLTHEQRVLAIEAAHERLLAGPDGEPSVIEGTATDLRDPRDDPEPGSGDEPTAGGE